MLDRSTGYLPRSRTALGVCVRTASGERAGSVSGRVGGSEPVGGGGEEQPLLCVVDDAQCSIGPSADARVRGAAAVGGLKVALVPGDADPSDELTGFPRLVSRVCVM